MSDWPNVSNIRENSDFVVLELVIRFGEQDLKSGECGDVGEWVGIGVALIKWSLTSECVESADFFGIDNFNPA